MISNSANLEDFNDSKIASGGLQEVKKIFLGQCVQTVTPRTRNVSFVHSIGAHKLNDRFNVSLKTKTS